MTFSARSNNKAIQVKMNIDSANLPYLKTNSLLKKAVEPLAYVSIQVDQNTKTVTKKARCQTVNPTFNENVSIIVKPDSKITFYIMSYHKTSTDKVIAFKRISIQELIQKTPQHMQVSNITLNLDYPISEIINIFPKEEIYLGYGEPSMTLKIQICDWDSFVHAVSMLENENNGGSSNVISNTNTILPSLSSISTSSTLVPKMTNSNSNTSSTNYHDMSVLTAKLPPHFEARWCDKKNKVYYVDHLTRTTSWKKPLNLPPDWERRFDSNTKRVYYVCHTTRFTQWKHPLEVDEGGQTSYTARGYLGSNQQEVQLDTPKVDEDLNEDDVFNNNSLPYTNKIETKELSDQLDLLNINEDDDSDFDKFDKDDIEAKRGKLTKPWEAKTTQNGRKYYVNHDTKTSQWEDPRTLGLQLEYKLPKGWERGFTTDGVVYYINHTTKKTSWDPWAKENIKNPEKTESYVKTKRQFQEKWATFQKLCNFNTPEGYLKVPVERANIMESSYRFIMADVLTKSSKPRHPSEYRKRLFITFDKEEGLDYGGLAREFFYLLSHTIANQNYGLFEQTTNYTLSINPHSKIAVGDEYLYQYRFVGRIVGMCLYHKRFLDLGFNLPFYKKLLNKQIKLSDIADVDEDYYKNLRFILESNLDEMDDLGIDFTTNEDNYGEIRTIELKPGGENIPLTNDNKKEYVRLMVNWRFSRGVEQQMNAICQGIKEIIPIEWLYLFDEHDLEVALCGVSKIDVSDWEKNTIYKNYSASDKNVRNFWKWVSSIDEDTRLKLLQFVTGTCRIPQGGFADLMGSNGPQRFCIEKTGKEDHLPKAHTCFNRLDLPNYNSYDQLCSKIEMAINYCSTGFGLE